MIIIKQYSSKTKLVVKPSFSGEFVQLSVLIKHLRVGSALSSVGRRESSILHKEMRRSLSRAIISRKETT